MSELLKDPDNFAEGPLYVSVDKATNQMLDYKNVRDRKDRDRFIKRALTNDVASMPGREIRFARFDSNGIFEIFPEVEI